MDTIATKRICTIEGCNKLHKARGFCKKHYTRWLRHKDPNKTLIIFGQENCKVVECDRKHHAKGFCCRHWQQVYLHGKVITRTRYNSNQFIYLEDKITKIILYNMNQNEVSATLVDSDMAEILKDYKWCMCNGYVGTTIENKIVRLHHFVIGSPLNNLEVDHINGNKLDNRRENLRLVTKSQNQMNRGLSSNNTSGTKGVCWDKNNKKWEVRITYNCITKHLGRFTSKSDAIAARRNAEIKYFGRFMNDDSARNI